MSPDIRSGGLDGWVFWRESVPKGVTRGVAMNRRRTGMLVCVIAAASVVAQGTFTQGQSRQVEWTVYGGDPAGSKYSPVDDITVQNVQHLKIAWQWEHGEQPIKEYNTTPFRFENQPLMVDGVLYVTTPYN